MDRCRAVQLLLSGEAIRGILTWPTFSLSSFHILKQLRTAGLQPCTIIDVGANIGQFSVAASQIFPDSQIWAFEPVPDSFEILSKNLGKSPRVLLQQCAIGAANESMDININSHRHSSSLLALGEAHSTAFPFAREETKVRVEVKTLDSLENLFDLKPPVLLKVDVQGFEAHVIRGAPKMLQQVDFVVIETSFQPLYIGEMTFLELGNLMVQNGFEFVGPLDWLSHPKTGDVLQMDALFKRSAPK